MNLSLSWQQRKDILWAPSSHQIMLRYNTMLDWLTYKIIFGDPRLLRYSILQIVCSCPSAMKNAGKVLTLHIFPKFTLGTIHNVRLHFFSISIPLFKKYVSICQIEFAGNQGKHQNWVLSILSHNFWLIFMGIKQFFFEKRKKNQNGWLQKTEVFKIANSQKCFWKFYGLVLGLVYEKVLEWKIRNDLMRDWTIQQHTEAGVLDKLKLEL